MDRPNRMKLQSADGAQLNLDALYQIAPSCFTEVAEPDTGGQILLNQYVEPFKADKRNVVVSHFALRHEGAKAL